MEAFQARDLSALSRGQIDLNVVFAVGLALATTASQPTYSTKLETTAQVSSFQLSAFDPQPATAASVHSSFF